ncbi:putative isoaspartyl peptidase/L-asparaginase 2, partial [Mucuna pruriens]
MGSTAITISNCHMTKHNNLMLFGARYQPWTTLPLKNARNWNQEIKTRPQVMDVIMATKVAMLRKPPCLEPVIGEFDNFLKAQVEEAYKISLNAYVSTLEDVTSELNLHHSYKEEGMARLIAVSNSDDVTYGFNCNSMFRDCATEDGFTELGITKKILTSLAPTHESRQKGAVHKSEAAKIELPRSEALMPRCVEPFEHKTLHFHPPSHSRACHEPKGRGEWDGFSENEYQLTQKGKKNAIHKQQKSEETKGLPDHSTLRRCDYRTLGSFFYSHTLPLPTDDHEPLSLDLCIAPSMVMLGLLVGSSSCPFNKLR